MFVLDRAADSIVFHDVPSRPVPSLFRGFSAPVKLSLDLADEELLALLRHDSDPFNRWQAAQTVALRFLTRGATSGEPQDDAARMLALALGAFLESEGTHDPAFSALVLTLPSEAEIAQEIGSDVDPSAVFAAREAARADDRPGARAEARQAPADAHAAKAPIHPMRQAPAAARCVTPASTSSRPPIRRPGSRLSKRSIGPRTT